MTPQHPGRISDLYNIGKCLKKRKGALHISISSILGCYLQAKMQTVNRSMVNIVGALERSLAGNNLEKMAEVRQPMPNPSPPLSLAMASVSV